MATQTAKKRRRYWAMWVAGVGAVVGVVATALMVLPGGLPVETRMYVYLAERAARDGTQGWPDEVRRLLERADETVTKKQPFVERLLQSGEAAVRAEAVYFMVKHPETMTLDRVNRLKSDRAINQFMETNAETAERELSGVADSGRGSGGGEGGRGSQ